MSIFGLSAWTIQQSGNMESMKLQSQRKDLRKSYRQLH